MWAGERGGGIHLEKMLPIWVIVSNDNFDKNPILHWSINSTVLKNAGTT